jgi:hypothetical protein
MTTKTVVDAGRFRSMTAAQVAEAGRGVLYALESMTRLELTKQVYAARPGHCGGIVVNGIAAVIRRDQAGVRLEFWVSSGNAPRGTLCLAKHMLPRGLAVRAEAALDRL